MSVEQDIFLIGVTGSRKNITRMLNAAIRNVAAGDPIVESDDIETTNRADFGDDHPGISAITTHLS